MTDISQVSLALAYVCAQAIYPQGLSAASITGRQTVIRRGWLLPNDMYSAQSVRDSVDYVTVTAALEGFRPVAEPLGWPWREGATIAPTVGVSCSGAVANVTAPASGAVCGVVGLRWETGAATAVTAAYAASSGDTAASIAAGLAAGLPGATARGASVGVASGVLTGQVAGYGQSVRVTRRQNQKLRLSIWTSSAMARDALGSALDTALAGMGWLATLDGGEARLSFDGAGDVDTLQVQSLYRRDLVFNVLFDTIESQWAAQMLFRAGAFSGPEFEVAFGDAVMAAAGQSGVAALAAEAAAVQGVTAASPYAGLSVDAFGTVCAVG
ncbi:hypothetical protein [Acidomonas methanolica]|uniref:hypothetical protein n=1 Tax=Acidomonas methanolica TaxID=437 RepID=UPI00211A9089|nr:hypothetical protein [Acidomonas methanolica]MCQ9154078.1 hypothetical protein [Acidomonas methanolica]